MLTLATLPSRAVNYEPILGDNESITGVRGYDGSNVILTGSYIQSGVTYGMWWRGNLSTGAGTMYKITPNIAGQTVTSSLFYGPNTALFDPTLGPGNIRVVGSYQYSSATYPSSDHGAMYTGSVDGSGTWVQIDVPSSAVGGASVLETIPHSTMGNYVVGNYDLDNGSGTPIPASANAFLYNISENSWTTFDIGGTSNFTSAYGIWQNSVDSYTIVGGSMFEGINRAYLIDYTPSSESFSNLTFFDYEGPGLTHFEGITEAPGGYNVVGTTEDGAVFAYIARTETGFSEADWIALAYPESTGLTTGNTVFQNIAMGVYTPSGGGEHSYTAAVPEPGTYALLALGALVLGLACRRSSRVGGSR